VYSERFSLTFLAGALIAAAERRRPGLGGWSPEVRGQLLDVFVAELSQARTRFLETFDDLPYWERAERTLLEDCFPRYCAEAEKQTALEQHGYGIWRGGDVIARTALAIGGLIVGTFLARAPFIPLPTSADIVVFTTGLCAPFLPDAQIWFHKRRFRKSLDAIVRDMGEAAAQQQLYQSLHEPGAGAPDPIATSSSSEDPVRTAATRGRERG
jgi:hypothetical protein